MAGGQIGYNWQINNFVLGVEADGDWLSRNNNSGAGIIVPGIAGPIAVTSNSTWLTTAAARFGFTVNRALIYGKAGGGWVGQGNLTITNLQRGLRSLAPTAEPGPASCSVLASNTRSRITGRSRPNTTISGSAAGISPFWSAHRSLSATPSTTAAATLKSSRLASTTCSTPAPQPLPDTDRAASQYPAGTGPLNTSGSCFFDNSVELQNLPIKILL